eukprot:TRINITY_DN19489_c0_g2_i2.p1 TRINITY_DN19489_c0_g2~~TRINITY_DN19489_c0_g2_i2.p1  ORF type:complete len:764 (+),score=177.65 TRINITY_DN19489_c0_g2_i2:48-2339(+)
MAGYRWTLLVLLMGCPSIVGQVEWNFDTGAEELATPVLWEGMLFSVSASLDTTGRLVALGEDDGVLVWDHILYDTFATMVQPVVYVDSPGDAILFIPSVNQLLAINASDPYAVVWGSEPTLRFSSQPSLGSLYIYVTTLDTGSVHALRPRDGKEAWSHTLYQDLSAPAYVDVQSMVVVAGENMVYAFDARDGSSQWNISVAGKVTSTSPPLSYGPTSSIYVTTMVNPDSSKSIKKFFVYSISVIGKINWAMEGEGAFGVSEPIICTGKVIFTSWNAGGNVTALRVEDGSTAWSVLDTHNLANLSEPVCAGDLVFVTASTTWAQDLWALATADGEFFWSTTVVTPTACSQGCLNTFPPNRPTIDGTTAFVAGIDRTVYAMTIPTQNPTPVPSSSTSVPVYVGYIAAAGGVVVVCLVLCIPKFCKKEQDQPAKSPSSGSAPGSPESRYIAIRKLGSGSYGTVYEVKCKKDGRLYALKRIPCDSDTERIEAIREWRVLCGIEHPNKITAYETFMNWSNARAEDEDMTSINHMVHRRFVCIVMQYCPEGDLKQYIQSFAPNEKVPEEAVLSFAGQLCSLLSVLHSRQPPLMHRDLKPENILLDEGHTKVIVTDFGLARSVMTYCRTHAGTLAFIAPETWDRHYSTGADIWAVGCIIYAMVTKRVTQDEVRCLWREANEPGFQDSISDEILNLGYSDITASTAAQLLTPDRRRRPTAVQALQWLQQYVPQSSMKYSAVGDSQKGSGTAQSNPQQHVACSAEDAGSFMS